MNQAEVEHVLVVPTDLFHSLGYFQGFTADVDTYLDTLFDVENISYRPRPQMEQDPNFKQLIPYVIFRYIDDSGAVSLYQYSRGGGSGEKRLVSKKSVGIGGHISQEDGDSKDADPYHDGMARELKEEVIIETPYVLKLVGLINDDETEVGKVHLGIVHICDVEAPRVRSNEEEIEGNGFQPVTELLDNLEGFETWSSICLQALFS
ncbi:MAG: phosphoesterase [Rhodopirellula sp.]|nr:phosphoesterase [Rhodopirellula sp.]|tara:strand:- start:261 stop:878 length:618 start_codon:yes stop_codon:yes gene_type:complete